MAFSSPVWLRSGTPHDDSASKAALIEELATEGRAREATPAYLEGIGPLQDRGRAVIANRAIEAKLDQILNRLDAMEKRLDRLEKPVKPK